MCITLVITSFKKSPQVIQVICVFGKQKSKADLSAGKPPGMLCLRGWPPASRWWGERAAGVCTFNKHPTGLNGFDNHTWVNTGQRHSTLLIST